MPCSGGQWIVKALEAQGVKRAFCVAGESYLSVLDACLDYPAMEMVTCRQESGATFAAEAYAQLSGEVGVAMVTRGPGACNASIGVHTAHQSSTPMVMLVGLHSMKDRSKEAFQEFDLPQMFDSICKWAAVIDDVARIPEFIARAFHVAKSGRGGPVVLGLPEEILSDVAEGLALPVISVAPVRPREDDLKALVEMLAGAERPMVLVGGGGWSDQACADLESFAFAAHLPVSTSFRRQDLFNHNHVHYVGEMGTGPNPALVQRFKHADVVLVLGARLSEITTQGYTALQEGQKIIHVYPDAEVFGQSVMPDLAIVADLPSVVSALASGSYKIDGRMWSGWREDGRADYETWSAIDTYSGSQGWDGADMTQIFAHIRNMLPETAVVTTDAGNFSGWAQRYLRYGRPGRLVAPISGAMGYGVPSAVAASLADTSRTVVGFCGDGGFMMTSQELATAVHHGAKPIIIVCNNSVFGTIKMHQQRDFPDRPSATDLTNPDFVALANSYGAFSERVDSAEAFADVFARALAADKLALIEITQDPRQSTTNSKL